MASGKTLRKLLPFPKPTDADKLCADQEALAKALDEVNEGHQDFLQSGVVSSTDWSFTATITSGGELGSEAATGGTAWLPDPVVSGALMRSVTSSASLTKLKPSELPVSGKFMTIGFELTPSTWGAGATVSVKSGTEKTTQAEAEAASPATTAGKIRVRDVVIKNTSGVYSIVKQTDRRGFTLNGERLATESVGHGSLGFEVVQEGNIAPETVTGAKLGEGTVRFVGELYKNIIAEPETKHEPSKTRPTFIALNVIGKTTEGNSIEARVDGVVADIVQELGAGTSYNIKLTFFCPPAKSWEVTPLVGRGKGQISSVTAYELTL